MVVIHSLEFLTRLELVHIFIDHSDGAVQCRAESVLQELEIGEHNDLSPAILDWIVQQYPAKLTDKLLWALAGRYIKELCLKNCKNVTVDGICRALTRCQDLEALNMGYCDHVAVPEVFYVCTPLCHVTAVSLEGNCEMKDSTVHTMLHNLTNLRDLNISYCDSLTDEVFLLDEGKQALIEIYGFVDNKCSVKLASVEMACTNLSNTAIRHLVTLCGPTLRNVSIGWTEVDCAALLFLSGYGLPAVVDILLSHPSSFNEKEKEILQQDLKELEETTAKYKQLSFVAADKLICNINSDPSADCAADTNLPDENSEFLESECKSCQYCGVSVSSDENKTWYGVPCDCDNYSADNLDNCYCVCALTLPACDINQINTGFCLPHTVVGDYKAENINGMLVASGDVKDRNLDNRDDNLASCPASEVDSSNLDYKVEDITGCLASEEVDSRNLDHEVENITGCLASEEVDSNSVDHEEENITGCLASEEVDSKSVDHKEENITGCLASEEVDNKSVDHTGCLDDQSNICKVKIICCCSCHNYSHDHIQPENIPFNNNSNNVKKQVILNTGDNTTKDNSFKAIAQIFKPNLISLNMQKIQMINVRIANKFLRKIIDANPNLQRLCFEWEAMNGEMLDYVCSQLPGLKDIRLLDCKSLGTLHIANLGRMCKELVIVDLQGVCFIGSAAVVQYTENNNLKELSLAESNVTDLFLERCVRKAKEGFQLRKLDLSWCEEISETGLNTFCSCSSSIEDLSFRHLPATDCTLSLIADSFQHLTRLVISTVSDISDIAVCRLAQNLLHLEEVDISWNSDLTDISASAILRNCVHLKTALFGGLKQLTTDPFLPIISDITKWKMCRVMWRLELKEGRTGFKPSKKVEEDSEFYVPHRSTSYVAKLQRLDLSYCNLVCDEYLEDIVAICRGSLKISDYFGTAIHPSFITNEDGKCWQD